VKEPLFQRLDNGIRHLLPLGLTLVLVLVNVVPTRLPGFTVVAPLLPLMSIFYWSIHRPDLLPSSAAFGAGIVNDIMAGTPLGVSSLIYLLVRASTTSQRRFFLGKPFFLVWCGFGLYGACGLLLQWCLISMVFGRLLGVRPVLFELAMTVSFYPLLSWLFARAQLTLLRRA
jgi:rod shape-determining protein MreD